MKNKFYSLLGLSILALIFTGCKSTSYLPSNKTTTFCQWDTYNTAMESYQEIEVNVTTIAELKDMGYDPYKSPNLKILTYLDVMREFMPNSSIKKEDLPYTVRRCIEDHEQCYAYLLSIENMNKQREGNVVSDLFGFRKNTRIEGWTFQAIIIINNGLVVYKISSGQPKVTKYKKVSNPLGPLQSINVSSSVKSVLGP
ncbi:MAG: hypothetical protein HRT89_05125 [Lentisphaeria bacterium]|nr:hypothetical protein [Lentisphaeria bacterium]NQZ67432.1 hypothetical protein [Lentisphaeria bacterium]